MQVTIGSEVITGVQAVRLDLEMGPGQPSSSTNITPTTAIVVEPDQVPGTGTSAPPADGGTGETPPAAS